MISAGFHGTPGKNSLSANSPGAEDPATRQCMLDVTEDLNTLSVTISLSHQSGSNSLVFGRQSFLDLARTNARCGA